MGLSDTVRFIAEHPLSQGRRFRNLSRFVGWQLRSRIYRGVSTFRFANGTRMYVRRGMRGVTANLYVGLDEFHDMSLLMHLLRPRDLFVDIGANVGSYTVLAAGAIGADVVAFEPGAQAHEWLARNIALNACESRVEVRAEAVGSFCGTRMFTTGRDTTNHILSAASLEDDGSSAVVQGTTLDAALAGRRPLMLKVDVEGFETEVIRGAAETLATPSLKCVLLELAGGGTSHGYDETAIRQHLKSCGFETYRYDPFGRTLTPTSGNGGNNAVFVRDLAFVEERLLTAPPFRVLNSAI